MAAHERCKYLQTSLCPLQNFALSGERERRRLIFLIFMSNSTLYSMFSFEIVLTVRNKLNDFTVSRDL